MRRLTFKVQGPSHSSQASFLSSFIPRPKPAPEGSNRGFLDLHSSSPGFAYVALLVAIVIIGISLSAAGKYWSYVVLRDKEEELIFRGEQYRQAIDRYITSVPGRRDYPQSIDDLLKDSRSAAGKRHLRQKYKDPMTGEDFVEIKNVATKRIIGVRSSSDKECLKQTNFPPTVLVPISAGTYSIPLPFIAPKTSESEGFASDKETVASDKMKYSDWLFISSALTGTMGVIPGVIPGNFPGGIPRGVIGSIPTLTQ